MALRAMLGLMRDLTTLPADLPVPDDDGAADHLTAALLPELTLTATTGAPVALADLHQPTVLFFYPRTGVPDQPPLLGPAGQRWESIAGARGCTPQSCGYRDLSSEFATLGVTIYGVSTQTTEFQRAFVQRNQVPFALLSDADLALTQALRLPTFQFPVAHGGPDRLIKRMSWLVYRGRIAKVWYPVFPPQQNAEQVLGWLREHLPLYVGLDWQGMVIARETRLASAEIAQLFASSGIRRPHQDPARLATMFAHANLVVTVRRNGALVGLTRCFCDGAWTCYVADLAVHADHQRAGIGKALLQAVSTIAGPRCSVVLSAGVGAEGYYAKVGFAPIPSG